MTTSASSKPQIGPFILASGSPRRKELLERAGYDFTVVVSSVYEPDPTHFASPEAYVAHTAWLKASTVAETQASYPILAADTVAALDGHILGKPRDREDARRILSRLAGTHHRVLTGICLLLPKLAVSLVAVESTTVEMKQLGSAELESYLDSGLWEGKAGAYGIQDQSDPFIKTVEGSFTNVVGLPMERLASLFELAKRLIG